jgi:hypothetical protein
MKKRYTVKNPIRFIVVLLICTVLINGFISNIYKSVYADSGVEVENLEQFIQKFSVIPEEVKEYMDSDFILLNIDLSEDLQRFTYDICKKYDIDYITVLSVFATESEFKSYDKSKNQVGGGYSIGIGQLNQNYIKWFGELTAIENFDIYDNKHNIEGSIAVLKFYQDYWISEGITDEDGLWYLTLNSYNMGIEGYKGYLKSSDSMSRHYDRKVLKNKIKLEQGGY